MTGRLLGIARHARPRAAMQTVAKAEISVEAGMVGDFRGAVKPGGKGRRQVTVMSRAGWDAAMADLGGGVPWWMRRANLLVDGVTLPRTPGTRIAIGADVVLEITGECDPCSRMEEVARGLKAALTPDWRGGVTTRVIAGGAIAVDDEVRIETA